MKHSIVYQDPAFYSAFPCVTRLADGRLMVLFRRAPQRKPYSTHLDSQSQAVAVFSSDGGATWGAPQVVWEEPGNVGVQDPSVMTLRDGTLLASAFLWQVVKEDPFNHHVKGTFVRRSEDQGGTWSPAVRVAPEKDADATSGVSAATTEPIVELPDGELLLPMYNRNEAFLFRSADGGRNWTRGAVIACDSWGGHYLGEPALGLMPSGKLVCMLRETSPGYLWQTESTDGGHTWSKPFSTPVWGFPANLLSLRDGRVLCTYGYRRPPFGVRACLSTDEGRTWNLREELVLRNDGLHGDVGYPSATQLPDGSILTAYYFHTGEPGEHNKIGHYAQPAGTRYIGCTTYRLPD